MSRLIAFLFHKLIVKHSTLVGVNQSISKFMDKDIFMFGDSGNSSIASMLPALIQNRGLDPNAVFAMMGNRQGGGFGNGNDFFAILLLFILMGAWGNNGFGGGFGGFGGFLHSSVMVSMFLKWHRLSIARSGR